MKVNSMHIIKLMLLGLTYLWIEHTDSDTCSSEPSARLDHGVVF